MTSNISHHLFNRMVPAQLTALTGNSATVVSATAKDRVFAIEELLENILIHVDYESLFECKQVNKTFHAILAGSKKMRALMMLDLPRRDKYFRCPLYDDGTMASIFHPFSIIGNRDAQVGGQLFVPFRHYEKGGEYLGFDLAENTNEEDWAEVEIRTCLKDNEDLDSTPSTQPGHWRGIRFRRLQTIKMRCQNNMCSDHFLYSENDITLGQAMDFCVDTTKKCWAGVCPDDHQEAIKTVKFGDWVEGLTKTIEA